MAMRFELAGDAAAEDERARVVLESLTPTVDGGRFPVKRVVGEPLRVLPGIEAIAVLQAGEETDRLPLVDPLPRRHVVEVRLAQKRRTVDDAIGGWRPLDAAELRRQAGRQRRRTSGTHCTGRSALRPSIGPCTCWTR